MGVETPRQHNERAASYRIAELVEQSGVSREMIKYYLRANLLPKPDKPRANLSLYSNRHLLLIRLILRFQEQTKLSLNEIADVFEGANHDPAALELELLSDKYAARTHDTILPFDDSTNSSGSLSFSAEFIALLKEKKLLPAETEPDEDKQQIAGLLWAATQEGVPLSFFEEARTKVLELADLEVKTMLGIQRPGLHFDAVIESITHVDRIINRWAISEKTSHARATFTRILDNSEKALSTVHDALYIPSKVFRTRFNVEQELAQLQKAAQREPQDLDQLHRACRAAVLFAEFEIAISLADSGLVLAPQDDLCIAFKCLAYGMDLKLDEARVCAQRLEASDCHHPIAMEARLLTLLMQAAKLSGVSDTSELLKDSAELFREPLSVMPDTPENRFEATLLNARAKTIFPDAFHWENDAIADLEDMLQSLENNSAEELSLPTEGTRRVFQIYADFYLGQLYEAAGEADTARQHFENVIQLDPASNFGEMAYLKLA